MDKEDNPKSRGLKPRINKKKDKSKYKGRIPPPPKPKANLETNWDRYDQEPTESKVNSSTDFAILANAPITHGNHFQFKSDREIAAEISEPGELSKLFNLDLTLLDRSLSTIPFNIRSGIVETYFTKNQHRRMTALDDKISDYMAGYQKVVPDVIFGSESEVSAGDDDNDVVIDAEPPVKHPVSTHADLEQWLDDILDN